MNGQPAADVPIPSVAPEYSTDSWCTPQWLCDALGGFDLDPCSNPRSLIKSRLRFQLEPLIDSQLHIEQCDGLAADWDGSVFCNPPYSDPFPWAKRLVAHNGPWVALLKLDTTTRWWATLMSSGATWAPFRARLKFEQPGKVQTANFASALVWSCWCPSRELAARLWLPTYGAA